MIDLLRKRLEKNHLLLFILIFAILAVFILNNQIIGDPFSYYAWVRSALFDHDFNFLNEYTKFNPGSWTALAWPENLAYTQTGMLNNPFSIGPGLLWLPAVLIAYFLTFITNFFFALFGLEAIINDGYSFYYQFLVCFWNYLLGLAGIYFTYLVVTKFFGKRLSLYATLAIVFGTAVFNYLYNEPTSSHNTSLFIIGLLYFLLFNQKEKSIKQWFLIGLVSGFVFLVRWQQIIFLLPVAWELFQNLRNKAFTNIISFCLIFFPTISLQFLAWWAISGSFIFLPQGTGFVSLTGFLAGSPPAFIRVLFSANHGLFYWTPVVAIAVIGLIFCLKKYSIARWGLLIFILSLVINSNLSDLFGGYSFSGRRFIENSFFLTFGLAGLIKYFKENFVFLLGLVFLILWNFALTTLYIAQVIPGWGYLVFPNWLIDQFSAWKHIFKFVGHSSVGRSIYYFLDGKGYEYLAFAVISLSLLVFGFLLFYKILKRIPGK